MFGMKVLMIGLGGIGQRHLRNLHHVLGDDLEPIAYRVLKRQAVVTDSLAVIDGETVDDRYNVAVFTDLKEALSEKPSVAFICNPSSMHIPSAIEAAKAGCHLFIEKPLSHNTEGVEELKTICEEKGLVCYIAFQMRYHPVLKALKDLVGKSALGNLLSVRAEVCEYMPAWHKFEDYRSLYAARKDLGGGVVLSQIHEFDYLYWLFGMPSRVFALGGQLSALDIDVEDTADVLMEMRHKGRPLPVTVHMDYLKRPPTRACRIIGDNGTIHMDYLGGVLKVVHTNGEEDVYDHSDFARNEMFIAEVEHFFDCIENGSRPLIGLEDGLNSLRIALSVKEALANG
jgi:predicted dehydrogenase